MPDASKERSIFNMSEFDTGKGLLIKKTQLEKARELILKSMLRESGIQVSFRVKRRENGRGKGWV